MSGARAKPCAFFDEEDGGAAATVPLSLPDGGLVGPFCLLFQSKENPAFEKEWNGVFFSKKKNWFPAWSTEEICWDGIWDWGMEFFSLF